jgi:hypothetical protein
VPKGKLVNIPARGFGIIFGNETESRDSSAGPEESSLFFLTVS